MEKGIWKKRSCSHKVTCYEGVLSTPGKGSNRAQKPVAGMSGEMGRASLAVSLPETFCVGEWSLELNGKLQRPRRPGGGRESQEG